jgi:urease accessory protein
MSTTGLLHLLHLSDSALPIGGTAHSCGLETLTSQGWLTPSHLLDFGGHYLVETGTLEAFGCQRRHDLGTVSPGDE